MVSLHSSEIRGTWGTVLLPINTDDSIDYVRLTEQVDVFLRSGVDGIYTNGTAGEFYSQTEAEFDRVCEIVATRAAARNVPFQLGASHYSPQITLERVQRARGLHPGAIQVILPDWLKVGNDEAVAFLSRIATAAAPIGIVLYNPPHAKRVLEPADLAKLRAAVPGLIGVKVGDGAASWYAAMRLLLPDFSVFVPGHHLATGYLQGANGSYSNIACLQPKGAVRWWGLMQTDPLAALAIERKILGFFREHLAPLAAQGFSGPAIDKLLCAAGRWCPFNTRLRWPYRYLGHETALKLSSVVRTAIPELFAE